MIATPSIRARLGIIAIGAAFLLVASASMASAGQGKTTICHAAGRAEPNGPTQYVKITISNSALYGQNGNAGHFDENGTPAAGHEQDFILYGSSCDNGGGEGGIG